MFALLCLVINPNSEAHTTSTNTKPLKNALIAIEVKAYQKMRKGLQCTEGHRANLELILKPDDIKAILCRTAFF